MITMKRKGFTLIELLAVIVILAIIALIATPTILGVIEKARKGSAEQSALGYIDAVEKQVAINQVKNENLINDGTYNVPMTDITVKGEAPTKGWLKIEKGMVTNYSFVIGKYVITKGSETVKGDEPTKSEEEVTKTYSVYSNGTTIYYNPETNSKCDESEAVSTTGTKTGCMKWYTFNDEGENTSTVNMILDHNTTAIVSSYNESKTKLITDTANWNDRLQTRLIAAEEVATIVGNTSFNKSNSFYLSGSTSASTGKGVNKYDWLFNNTHLCIANGGCSIEDNTKYSNQTITGYWTDTQYANSNINTYYVSCFGHVDYQVENTRGDMGVRPVITISKDIIF